MTPHLGKTLALDCRWSWCDAFQSHPQAKMESLLFCSHAAFAHARTVAEEAGLPGPICILTGAPLCSRWGPIDGLAPGGDRIPEPRCGESPEARR